MLLQLAVPELLVRRAFFLIWDAMTRVDTAHYTSRVSHAQRIRD